LGSKEGNQPACAAPVILQQGEEGSVVRVLHEARIPLPHDEEIAAFLQAGDDW